jgi:hypothetical protein
MEEINNKDRLYNTYVLNNGESVKIIRYKNALNLSVIFSDGTILDKITFRQITKGTLKKPHNKVGEEFLLNNGEIAKIVEYKSCSNCTIEFLDGSVKNNVSYGKLKIGSVQKPTLRIGEKYNINEGGFCEIVEYFNASNCTIQFNDGNILSNVKYDVIKRGKIKNYYRKSVLGVGFLGYGVYKVSIDKEHTLYYQKWVSMLQRCYCEKTQQKQPTYRGCSVDESWLNFQNFAGWFEQNWKPYMKGWHLDKDILIKGNKVYSPETCCFVPIEINSLLTKRQNARGKYPIGVIKYRKEFVFQCWVNGCNKISKVFKTPEEAFYEYKLIKEKEIKRVANIWKDKITEQVYQALINYEVDITD